MSAANQNEWENWPGYGELLRLRAENARLRQQVEALRKHNYEVKKQAEGWRAEAVRLSGKGRGA